MPANTTEIEKRLWDAADDLRANSKLKSSEYSIPVLGLIFLRYAYYKFEQVERELNGAEPLHATAPRTRRRVIGKADYQARGVWVDLSAEWFQECSRDLSFEESLRRAGEDTASIIYDESRDPSPLRGSG